MIEVTAAAYRATTPSQAYGPLTTLLISENVAGVPTCDHTYT